MIMKYTSLFVINKYKGLHTCVNPCLNRDHHQLDSNLVAAHIKAIIKAQFNLSIAAIQASGWRNGDIKFHAKRLCMEIIK